jgi:hypothetical protein
MSPASVRGDPRGEIFCRGDGFGELKPDGEFPVAIPSMDRPRSSLDEVSF